MKKILNNRDGFTLIEMVISIALISILSLGFLQTMVGFLGITQQSIKFDMETNEFAELIDSDNLTGAVRDNDINLFLGKHNGKSYSIVIDQYTLESKKNIGERDIHIYQLSSD